MKANEVKNTVRENVNTVENAQKLAKEQENPSYVAMFRPWIVEACGGLVDVLTQAINETITDANDTDERYKQLSTDYEKAKARFEAYQLKTVNGDRQTLKAFKKAVAVAVQEVAERTSCPYFSRAIFLPYWILPTIIFPHTFFGYLIVVCGCSSLCLF